MNEIIWTIIGTGASVVGLIYAILRNFNMDVNSKFDEMKRDVNSRFDEMKKDVNLKFDQMKRDVNSRFDEMKRDVNLKFDEMKRDVNSKFDEIKNEIKDVNLKLSDLDKRLYAVEAVLHMKDCCVLKQDQNLKKAE